MPFIRALTPEQLRNMQVVSNNENVAQSLLKLPAEKTHTQHTPCHTQNTPQHGLAGKYLTYLTSEIYSVQETFLLQCIDNAHRVINSNMPNVLGERIPLKTNWKIDNLEVLLDTYHDKFIIQLLKYGFPIARDYQGLAPTPNAKNHASALQFPAALDKYVKSEISHHSTIGAFLLPPFLGNVGISPLSTRAKKGTTERRVILDLSFPEGRAVNTLIDKNKYLFENVQLTYPSIDTLAKRVAHLGPGCLLWKRDLKRAFRQLPVCPGDYSFLGWRWRGYMYFDITMPMGLTSAAFCCQRTTNAIAHAFRNKGFFVVNYLDDFGSAESAIDAHNSFECMKDVFFMMGVQEAPDKAVKPTTALTFLGYKIDSVSMTIQIDEERLAELEAEVRHWLNMTQFKRVQLEQLIGKLQFVTTCVKGARVFICRLLNILRGTGQARRILDNGRNEKGSRMVGKILSCI